MPEEEVNARENLRRYMLDCGAWCHTTIRHYCPPSFSVCEQVEKLDVLDHAFTLTFMSASIGP